ncbi:sugar ABC transporter permease [Dyella mobilis]|uniref:Xylose transport system permease protein XylH n=1 Tax=Dyella mobilis TaxID=1849582 RepID=A0ABS2KAX1_9GAMM|nr:sugar ABC transporter permease [Dyella mobilis]MBM7127945.1 sugar ABC transporter permease [Dyella mobilis]GLQ99234.1 xylose ABC transporter permease [Dyella mobilis]
MHAQDFRRLFVRYKILALLLALAAIWIFFHVATGGAFISARNLSNLLRQTSITGMLACGMVFVIIAGEIDLSVGSLLGLLGGVVAVLTVNLQWSSWSAVLLVLLLGLAAGLFNGFIVTRLRVPSFIVGLGGMLAFRGVLQGITHGATIAPVPADLVYLAEGYLPPWPSSLLATGAFAVLVALTLLRRRRRKAQSIPQAAAWLDVLKLAVAGAVLAIFTSMLNRYSGIPLPVLLLLALLVIFSYVASQTVLGRHIYAVGGNVEASRLSGIRVSGVKMVVFGLMGLMCAFAGIINTARLAAGSPSAGTNGELDAIAACFIGGTSMRGGAGTVHGALIGALVMASLDNGMSMMDVDNYWQLIVKGAILVIAVWVDVLSGAKRD